MDVLEVPELLENPDPAPYDGNPVATADYLLTMLLRNDSGMLHSEFANGSGMWSIRPGAQRLNTSEARVAQTDTVGHFRAVLARFGAHYMGGQVYGGFTRQELVQRGRHFSCAFYMSNDNWTGYWIRVYAKAAKPA